MTDGLIRKAFVMSVNSGCEIEYERRHRFIWPELSTLLRKYGVKNYSIFLLAETRQLFAYVEIEDEDRWSAVAETDLCQQWWRHMAPLMPHDEHSTPITRDLKEVFCLQ